MLAGEGAHLVEAVVGRGAGVVRADAGDAEVSPRDGFAEMGAFARERRLDFPYLHDATQSVARAYDAACTPDFYGFDAGLGLQYRGRLDDSGRDPKPGNHRTSSRRCGRWR